jgi:hypothetical protein
MTEPRARRSHWWPRTRDGRTALFLFVALSVLAQWPFVHVLANRIEPRIIGLPFLYAYLLLIYIAMLGVLLWMLRRRI